MMCRSWRRAGLGSGSRRLSTSFSCLRSSRSPSPTSGPMTARSSLRCQSVAAGDSTPRDCQYPASYSSSSASTEPMSHNLRGHGVRSPAKKSPKRASTCSVCESRPVVTAGRVPAADSEASRSGKGHIVEQLGKQPDLGYTKARLRGAHAVRPLPLFPCHLIVNEPSAWGGRPPVKPLRLRRSWPGIVSISRRRVSRRDLGNLGTDPPLTVCLAFSSSRVRRRPLERAAAQADRRSRTSIQPSVDTTASVAENCRPRVAH
jgi:hypothetical protein